MQKYSQVKWKIALGQIGNHIYRRLQSKDEKNSISQSTIWKSKNEGWRKYFRVFERIDNPINTIIGFRVEVPYYELVEKILRTIPMAYNP